MSHKSVLIKILSSGFGNNSKANDLEYVHLKPGEAFSDFSQIDDIKKFKEQSSFYPLSKLNKD